MKIAQSNPKHKINGSIRNAIQTDKEILKSLGEQISHNTYDSQLRHLLKDKKKGLKQPCRRKKQEYIGKGISNIDLQNPKETWRQTGKISNLRKEKHKKLKQ